MKQVLMITLLAVTVVIMASGQTDRRSVNPLVIDTHNSHLAACDSLLEQINGPARTSADFLTGFEFDPFVFVASERSTSRLLVRTSVANVRKITITLSDLGPYFGAGTVDLLDGGISPDAVAGDGTFTGNVKMLNPPADAFGSRIIRNIGLTIQNTDLTTSTLTEDVAASFGYISTRDSVPVTQLSEGVFVSRYAANLVRPDLLGAYPTVGVNTQAATTAALQRLGDMFDWVVLYNAYNQRGSAAGTYSRVRNHIQGIGAPLSDSSASYGSNSKLRGVIQLFFKHASPMSHEIFHTWGVYGFGALGLNSTTGGAGHWGPIAHPNQTSIFGAPPTHNAFTAIDGGRFQGCFGTGPAPLNLELYLMGLIPGSALGSYSYLSNATWLDFAGFASCPQNGYVFSSSGIATMTLTNIVSALGARTPAYPDQSSFRAAVVTVTKRVLHPEEWDYLSRVFRAHQEGFLSDYQGHASVYYDLLPRGAVTTVSAASYSTSELASGSIAAAFATGMATTTLGANQTPLPTSLAGTSVRVKDSTGIERLASLFFVSPTQINFLVPAETSVGTAIITVISGDGVISTGTVQVAAAAPGLFSANGDGTGVPAAYAVRIRNNVQTIEQVLEFSGAQNKFVAKPLDLGPAGDTVTIVLFGTGFRGRSALAAVSCRIGGQAGEVQYASVAPGFVGLDQANVVIPRSLAGRGEVDVVLTVDGKIANTVKVNIL